MLDFRPILMVIGLLLGLLGIAMLVPALADAIVGNPDWQVFLVSAGVTAFTGVTLLLTNRCDITQLNLRQAFLLTTLSWLALAAFGALPFAFAKFDLSYADAFFESMSGITTTGSTVITGLDTAPPGILLWRALLQWLGGLGIIVMAVSVLPILQVGGMQMFRAEAFDTPEKILPRAAQLAGALFALYVALTAVAIVLLWLAGMTFLEATVHAMTTLSTGGYSTSDASVGHFDSELIDYIIVVFMVLGSLPFVRMLQVAQGRPRDLWRDEQVRGFIAITATAILAMALWQWLANDETPREALRYSAFNIVSLITGTGYVTADYSTWGSFAFMLAFFIMFVGGCAGSTSCGIKVFRFQVLAAHVRVQLRRLAQPHGVFVPVYNGRPVPESVISAVMGFFFLFAMCYVALTVALAALGLDFVTAMSAAGTALANVGPALGPVVGPAGNFQALPDAAKWVLSLGMLLGRLELLTVLILLSPVFWRA